MMGSRFYPPSFISTHFSFFYLQFCGHLSSWRIVAQKSVLLGLIILVFSLLESSCRRINGVAISYNGVTLDQVWNLFSYILYC